MKKTTLEQVSGDIVKLLEAYPITLSEPRDISIAQREALGRMFGDNVLRETLEMFVRAQNKNMVAAGNQDQHIYFKARMDTLLQLLIMGKTSFINFEMLRGKKPLTEKQRVHELEKQLSSEVSSESDLTRDERLYGSAGASSNDAKAEPPIRTEGPK